MVWDMTVSFSVGEMSSIAGVVSVAGNLLAIDRLHTILFTPVGRKREREQVDRKCEKIADLC